MFKLYDINVLYVEMYEETKISYVSPRPGTGASIPPETMMHFPPVSDFPLCLRKIFRLSEFFLQYYLFQKNFFTFIRQNFWWPFFQSSTTNFEFPPFLLFQYISPLFRENYSFPLLLQIFPPCFRQIHLLFAYFTCIFPPTLTMMHLCITQCTYWTPLTR